MTGGPCGWSYTTPRPPTGTNAAVRPRPPAPYSDHMWNPATITALASAIAAIAGAVIAIVHTLQHSNSSNPHNGTGPPGTGGTYRP